MTSQAICRKIRVRKEDSAFVYCILESYEGICSYSTLDSPPGDPYRDLELQVPVSFAQDVDSLIENLGTMVYDLDSPKNS